MLAVLLLLAAPDYSLKIVADAAPPEEVAAPIRKLLSKESVQLLDARGALVLEVWLRKTLPATATEAQLSNGLTFAEIEQSTILGAVRFPMAYTDYRKQSIAAGVYVMRLGIQPATGDHMGTAPHPEFALLCPAGDDKKATNMDAKALRELSARTTGDHPGVMVLFPGKKADKAAPRLVNEGKGHWVMRTRLPAVAGKKKGDLALGLTLVGVSASR